MKPTFFYGLFMDMSLLRGMGFAPHGDAKAELRDFKISIGSRAGLVPEQGSVVFGLIASLPDDDLRALYSAPGLVAYKPIPVTVRRHNNVPVDAICYNVAESDIGLATDKSYSIQLAQLVRSLGFPLSYADEIENGRNAGQQNE